MRRQVIVIGLFICLAANGLTKQTISAGQQRDCFLVPASATEVNYTHNLLSEQVTYVVNESYPATELLTFIDENLKQRNWRPLNYIQYPTVPSSQVTGWEKQGPDNMDGMRAEYRWLGSWEDNSHASVIYHLQYTNSRKEIYLKTLHVYVTYIPPQKPPTYRDPASDPTLPKPWGLSDELKRIGLSPLKNWDVRITTWLLSMSIVWIGGTLLVWAWFSRKPQNSLRPLWAFTLAIGSSAITMVPIPIDWKARYENAWALAIWSYVCLSFALLIFTVVISWRTPGSLRIASRVLLVITAPLFLLLVYITCDAYMVTGWLQRCLHDHRYCRYL